MMVDFYTDYGVFEKGPAFPQNIMELIADR